MSAKRFVIELRGGPASGRRTLEALDLAAGLAGFGHEVRLVVPTSGLATLAGAHGDPELGAGLDQAAAAGTGPAVTPAAEPPDRVGALAVEHGDAAAVRAGADAVLVF